jgi:ribosomal protein S18 acetylase RimI-like enzyme
MECACFGRARFLFGLWRRVAHKGTWAYVAEVNGAPAGYLIAYHHELDGRPVMYVGGVAVLPRYRRHGLGQRLMQTVLANRTPVWLHVRAGNEPAIALYRQLDMHARQRICRFYANGDDALILVTPNLLPAKKEPLALGSIYNAI